MAKGGTFENEVSQKLSLWLTNGKSDECVRRTEASGARATQRSKRKKVKETMFGDLCSSDKSVQIFFDLFSIEAKSGYFVSKNKKKKGGVSITNWSFNDIIDSGQKQNVFFTFWDQCLNDALKSNREPWLIFRRNRRQMCIAMYSDLFKNFCNYSKASIENIKIETPVLDYPESITICNLDLFLESVPYSSSLLRGPITKTSMKRRVN